MTKLTQLKKRLLSLLYKSKKDQAREYFGVGYGYVSRMIEMPRRLNDKHLERTERALQKKLGLVKEIREEIKNQSNAQHQLNRPAPKKRQPKNTDPPGDTK